MTETYGGRSSQESTGVPLVVTLSFVIIEPEDSISYGQVENPMEL